MQTVDVVLLTNNSEYLLERCLASIYGNIPVNKLIVVDGFSTDGTMKIIDRLKRTNGNVKTIKVGGSRALARQRGIRQVRTEWFMFVDSDVLLSPGWFKKAKKNLTSDVGAVWGVNIDVIPSVKDKRILKLQNLVARQCFSIRGGMHDTLIRREAVNEIVIPDQLHAYEDAYIINRIKERGYKIVVGDDIYCLHFKPPGNWSLRNGVSQALVEFRCGLIYSHMMKYLFYYPFFIFYWFVQSALQGAKAFSSH
jgi:glycosyltransferase involved in cell wall biosynthesis